MTTDNNLHGAPCTSPSAPQKKVTTNSERSGELVFDTVRTECLIHDEHEWEVTETLADNPIEVSVHAFCHTCDTSFVKSSVDLTVWGDTSEADYHRTNYGDAEPF